VTLFIPDGYAEFDVILTKVGDPEPMAVTFGALVNVPAFSEQAHCNRVFSCYQTEVLANHPATLTLTKVSGRFGEASGPPLIVDSTNLPAIGSSGATFLPQNIATLVQKRTLLSGRKNRGRFFFPYLLAESEVDDVGNVTVVKQGTLNADMADFKTALEAGTGSTPVINMVVLHTNPADLPTLVTALRVDGRIATQRRRLRR
jgi:hypothetical protein